MGLAPTPTPWSSCCSHTTAAAAAAAALLLAIPSSNPVLRRHRSLGRRPPPRRLRLILAASASPPAYNGWGELPDASPFSFPLLLFQEEKKDGLLLLLLPLLVVVPASAAALSRLPPLPLLVAAFTAGFVARHLASFSPQPSSSALILALADLDAQVRALRDHLTAAAAASSRPQPVVVLDAVDRLRDAVLHATRLARHDTTAPTLAPLGELADSVAAWARDTLRDLTSSTRNKPKDLDSKPKVSSPPVQQDAPGSATQDMLPFHTDDNDDDDGALEEDATTRTRTNRNSDLELERLLLKHRRTGSSSSSMESRRTLEIRDRSYYRLNIKCEKSHVSEAQEQVDPFSAAAATDSDCQEFSSNMKEAAEILKKARECMVAGADEEEAADALLYRSARLLSAAVALRPTSLVAVGQLGNTYLLHGELKLKVSRELRTLLANTGAALLNGRDPVPRSRKVNSTAILNRENISAALVDVCEECESLLVEAGRSYRTALSIDPADVKALYNWGLALIFRAQLLADIGPEAAVDADRVYLAAIDKFDAMLSKSNTYAPEALYRWGTALQQRSQLRPRNNREKIRLLEQAKSLFEDVLYVEADNKMVREALASCISELNYHGRWI